MNKVVITKAKALRTVKVRAAKGLIIPDGISLILVLGFLKSISRSKYLLKAIAALLAKTIHNTIKTKICRSNDFP
jgi:hypothetical protein